MKSVFKIFLILLVAVLLDQIAKGVLLYLIIGGVPAGGNAFSMVPYPYMMAHVTDFFNIVFTWNPGTSFSLFRSLGESAPIIIIVLTGVIIGFFGYQLLFRTREAMEQWALSLIVGGAMGNLIDRIRFGAVVDFLDFHWGAAHWPAFNIADICITVGVGLYALYFIIGKIRKG